MSFPACNMELLQGRDDQDLGSSTMIIKVDSQCYERILRQYPTTLCHAV